MANIETPTGDAADAWLRQLQQEAKLRAQGVSLPKNDDEISLLSPEIVEEEAKRLAQRLLELNKLLHENEAFDQHYVRNDDMYVYKAGWSKDAPFAGSINLNNFPQNREYLGSKRFHFRFGVQSWLKDMLQATFGDIAPVAELELGVHTDPATEEGMRNIAKQEEEVKMKARTRLYVDPSGNYAKISNIHLSLNDPRIDLFGPDELGNPPPGVKIHVSEVLGPLPSAFTVRPAWEVYKSVVSPFTTDDFPLFNHALTELEQRLIEGFSAV